MASREMTMSSDLDFILLYDVVGNADGSTGERPLATSQYFARLTQRLVAALSAPTPEGVLYHADMRLRPSGNAGPLATSLTAFRLYQEDTAWTWEQLALTRARVVVADAGFEATIGAAVATALQRSRQIGKTIDDVVTMRALVAKDRAPRHPFDLKLVGGGLIDLEFIAQSAQLVAGDRIGLPQAHTALVLARLGEVGLVPEGERLAQIHELYSMVLQVMSAALSDPFKEEGWTPAFRDLLAQLTNQPNFARLTEELTAMQGEVRSAAFAWYARAKTL
jgi:[glutamine synthetase] adenylyltransferase / [glutamine synthetase]-adenylyl-L-tyrosine phosphorylase